MADLDQLPFAEIAAQFRGINFRNPRLLSVTPQAKPKILLVGTCVAQRLLDAYPDADVDFMLFHSGVLPPMPAPPESYDAILCAVTLRAIMDDDALWRLPYHDQRAFEAEFRRSVRRLHHLCGQLASLAGTSGTPTFLTNFIVPVLNPNGRLFPGFDFANPQHFLRELNAELDRFCVDRPNLYCLDLDAITASYGKRYLSDEFMFFHSHNSFYQMPPEGMDGSRMEPSPHAADHYELLPLSAVAGAVFKEIEAQLRILKGTDSVKLIVVDLDDTLWRGVVGDTAAELDAAPGSLHAMIEGWPMGIAEALMYCKKRGILLAILSKNDEAVIRKVFPAIFADRVTLDDFAVVKVNFNDKPDNMAEILATTNLLPGNVLYIDDNPVERARMAARFPDIRVFGRYFQYTRHLLLNAPETQVATITAESAQRTRMIQGQAQRQEAAQSMDPQEFLDSLELKAGLFEIGDPEADPRAARAIELINKTNQWNSNGERVTAAQLRQEMDQGGRLLGFSLSDRFTHYGDICFVRLVGGRVAQFVMSCRVAGLRFEHAVMARLMALAESDVLLVDFAATPKNSPFAQFIRGFEAASDSQYRVAASQLPATGHVRFQ